MMADTSGFDAEQATKAYIDGLGPEALEKAANYTMGNHWLLLAGLVLSFVATFIIVRLGILKSIEDRFGPRSTVGIGLISIIYIALSTLISLPFTFYQEWWREGQYGRTSQPLMDFLGQTALGTGISTLITAIFLVVLYFFIRRTGRRWWIWGGGLSATALAALSLLAPVYLMPLFNSYEPLPDGEVREALEVMAKDAGIPADRIFVYDGSRQSNNFTANVAGIGGSSRIAISDVALGEASLDEVKAVTGHEIGHYVLNHAWRRVFAASLVVMALFFLADRTFGSFARFFGTAPDITRPSTLPVLVFIVSLYGEVLTTPAGNWLTRQGESEADRYSLETVNLPDALASALVKTAEYRDPRPEPWQELLFYTHPSVERRVRQAMEWKAATMQKEAAGTPKAQ